MRLVECVPNFSEGRRTEVIDRIVGAIRSVERAYLLDVSADADHNRTVVCIAGEPAAVAEAAFRGAAEAAKLIDMDQHHGAHPRFGAADVIPFIPAVGVTMADCVDLARAVGRRMGDELSVPVYLYGDAATRPERRRLASVRRGEYEGLRAAIENDPAKRPDFGPSRLGKAGATAVGARDPLIAYNVNLQTSDVSVAKDIAHLVREKSGGLPGVQALGLALLSRGVVQVSMNLLDYVKTSPQAALRAVRLAAEVKGVAIAGAELVGIVPADIVCRAAAESLEVECIDTSQVFEARVLARM